MCRMPRRAPLLKTAHPEASDIDPNRALRTIRILGAVNLVLFVAFGASLWWNSRAADALRINANVDDAQDQPVRVFMEARLSSNGKPIRSGDTVTNPTITVHGVISDFARLREGLRGLSVTIRGTRADIIPETGEFTDRVVLAPGPNRIEFGVWWDGRQWQRTHADITYVKPAAAPADAPEDPQDL